MFPTLKKLLDSFLPMGVPGFDIMICKDGQCIWRYQNGFSDLAAQKRFDGQERYNLYSCSKVITVTAALQLWEKKLFSLDEPLYLYLPEFEKMTVRTEDGVVPAKNQIRIRDLFCMTAGFTYDRNTPNLLQGIRDTDGRAPTQNEMLLEATRILEENALPKKKPSIKLRHLLVTLVAGFLLCALALGTVWLSVT